MNIKERLRNWLIGDAMLPRELAEEAKQFAGMDIDPRILQQFERNLGNSYLAKMGSNVVVARQIKQYEPPPGVIPDAHQLAMDSKDDPLSLAYDSGNNFMGTYGGWLNQNYIGLGFPGYAYLSELAQRSEYRAPSETTSTEMTRKFIKFNTRSKGDKSDKISKLESWFREKHVRQLCRKALEIDLFFGRSQLFIDIEGQDSDIDRSKPLVVSRETIKPGSVKAFKVIEPIWTSPYTYNATDPTKPDFYIPYAWYVLGRKIHNSRLITIISRPVPDLLKPAYNFGGISLTQLMEPYVIRWLRTVDGVNKLINNFSVLVLRTNMIALMQDKVGGPSKLLDRVRLFIASRDNQGLMVTDKDSEELMQIAVSLAGLAELQAQAQEHMAAPSHIPLVKLTGITPSGLNASSEGELTAWNDFIHSEQENVLEPVIDKILDLAQLDLFGEIDEDIGYSFVPLVESTLKEVADIRKSDGDLAVNLINAGVVSPDEVRESLQSNPDSGYSNLNGPAPEREDEFDEQDETQEEDEDTED